MIPPEMGGRVMTPLLGESGRMKVMSATMNHISPHRLEAQDAALSRQKHRFESGWGYYTCKSRTVIITWGYGCGNY